MNHFFIRLWGVMKSGFYTISSVVGPRRSSKALPKAKLAPRKGHGHWWSAADLMHYSFLNPGETITSKKYAQQLSEMPPKLQHLQLALVNRKDPVLLHNAWPHIAHQCFKSWMNWVTKFCLICHIHLTSPQPTITPPSIWTIFCRKNAPTTSRRQKMLSKSPLNPKAWIFTLQE